MTTNSVTILREAYQIRIRALYDFLKSLDEDIPIDAYSYNESYTNGNLSELAQLELLLVEEVSKIWSPNT